MRVGVETVPTVVELAAELGDASWTNPEPLGDFAGSVAAGKGIKDRPIPTFEPASPPGEVDAERGYLGNPTADRPSSRVGQLGRHASAIESDDREPVLGAGHGRENIAAAVGTGQPAPGLHCLRATERDGSDEQLGLLAALRQPDEQSPREREGLCREVASGIRAADVPERELGVGFEAGQVEQE